MKKYIINAIVFIGGLGIGFAGGMYTLPIIVSHKAKQIKMQENTYIQQDLTEEQEVVKKTVKKVEYKTYFYEDAQDSDFFHSASGDIKVTNDKVIFQDNIDITAGPDYILYAVPEYVETEKKFNEIKRKSVKIANIVIFDGKQEFKHSTKC